MKSTELLDINWDHRKCRMLASTWTVEKCKENLNLKFRRYNVFFTFGQRVPLKQQNLSKNVVVLSVRDVTHVLDHPTNSRS